MNSLERITFVSAVNDRNILEANLLASPVFQLPHAHQVLVQEGFECAAKAFNQAIDLSHNEIMVFVHQDVIFPVSWISDLRRAIQTLEERDPDWGVLGCYGETQDRQDKGYIYSPDMGTIGKPMVEPEAVQTLDEIVLIIRKSSGLRFDETLPHFHFYGAEICLASAKRNHRCYAIPAFCIHNTQHYLTFPEEFYECYRHVKRRWREFLPIQTSCITMTRFDLPLYRRRLSEFYRKRIKRRAATHTRAASGSELLSMVEAALQKATQLGPHTQKSVPQR